MRFEAYIYPPAGTNTVIGRVGPHGLSPLKSDCPLAQGTQVTVTSLDCVNDYVQVDIGQDATNQPVLVWVRPKYLFVPGPIPELRWTYFTEEYWLRQQLKFVPKQFYVFLTVTPEADVQLDERDQIFLSTFKERSKPRFREAKEQCPEDLRTLPPFGNTKKFRYTYIALFLSLLVFLGAYSRNFHISLAYCAVMQDRWAGRLHDALTEKLNIWIVTPPEYRARRLIDSRGIFLHDDIDGILGLDPEQLEREIVEGRLDLVTSVHDKYTSPDLYAEEVRKIYKREVTRFQVAHERSSRLAPLPAQIETFPANQLDLLLYGHLHDLCSYLRDHIERCPAARWRGYTGLTIDPLILHPHDWHISAQQQWRLQPTKQHSDALFDACVLEEHPTYFPREGDRSYEYL